MQQPQPQPKVNDIATGHWFAQPAASFLQSSPLGNGRIGAMVFGLPGTERIVINELSLWSGSPFQNDRADAHKALPEIRRLLFAGKTRRPSALSIRHLLVAGRAAGRRMALRFPTAATRFSLILSSVATEMSLLPRPAIAAHSIWKMAV